MMRLRAVVGGGDGSALCRLPSESASALPISTLLPSGVWWFSAPPYLIN